ncbi:MAG: hypothetical protein KBA38_05835 [Negativicutes bacterium]|nr:hypothetical protein [Negativicutes bacterium]
MKTKVGTEITIIHQGHWVTIQMSVSGMTGQPVVELLDRLQGSLML